MKKYREVAVGGTFDQLHRGHKALLAMAFKVGEKVVIGLSSDEFVTKMGKPHITANYFERKKDLTSYLTEIGLMDRAEIVPLKDPYGLTIKGKGLEALVVSKETARTASSINEARQKAGIPPLEIVAVDMIQAENNTPISTTRIRSGEIDRNGHMLKNKQK
jgi:pantetheine-phosphate adenylyltransferase